MSVDNYENSIKEMMSTCVSANTLIPCRFVISKTIDEKYIDEIKSIFEKYGVVYNNVDCVSGSFSLSRQWIENDCEKSPIQCIVNYNGVYPANWDTDDIIRFVQLEKEGKLIVMVSSIDK